MKDFNVKISIFYMFLVAYDNNHVAIIVEQ